MRLGVVGELEFRQPITEAKLLIKSLKFIQMLNSKSQAGTAAESITNVDVSTSSPNNAKPNVGGSLNWDVWLVQFESNLKDFGYKKFNQSHKNEDFAYWKTFYVNNKKAYQIGLLFYDFRKYIERDPNANRIGLQYKCMLLCDDRIDLSVSKDIDLPTFEIMAAIFYKTMSKFKK